jgi:Protein of unknown function (DUF2892)
MSERRKNMTCNVGGIERAIRIVIGSVLIALASFHGLALIALASFHLFTGMWAIAAYVVAAIAILTALVGFCPAWALFHINTSGVKHAKASGTVH